MAVDSVEAPFDMDKAKSFVSAADEMRPKIGWPDGVIQSQRRLMKAILCNEYDGPVWIFFGPDGPLRGDTDSQPSEAVEIRLSGRISEIFGNELSVFSEGGETSAADWITEFWLDGDHFNSLISQWKLTHPSPNSQAKPEPARTTLLGDLAKRAIMELKSASPALVDALNAFPGAFGSDSELPEHLTHEQMMQRMDTWLAEHCSHSKSVSVSTFRRALKCIKRQRDLDRI